MSVTGRLGVTEKEKLIVARRTVRDRDTLELTVLIEEPPC